jgi:hypothetical protein
MLNAMLSAEREALIVGQESVARAAVARADLSLPKLLVCGMPLLGRSVIFLNFSGPDGDG